MSWLFGGGHRPSPSRRHSRLSTQEQDDELEAAFGREDDDDEPSPSTSASRQDVRIDIDLRDRALQPVADSAVTSRLPQRGPTSSDNRDGRPPAAAAAADGDGDEDDAAIARPPSPAPAYDSSLTDAAASERPHPFDTHTTPATATWRDRLTSVVRYGRLATADPDAEGHSYPRSPHQPFGSGVLNDGVFANLVAKPEAPRRGEGLEIVGGDDIAAKEVPPSYDIAAADAAPPYWETTIIAPQGYLGPDDILVDGLPVGNLFGFAWNLLVSMSFQFVGFLLTYLLHTSHAAKNGSRAGLGITLIQWAFYMRQRASQLQDELDSVDITPDSSDEERQQAADAAWEVLWGGRPPIEPSAEQTPAPPEADLLATLTQTSDAVAPTGSVPVPSLHGNLPAMQQVMRASSVANNWLSYILLALGSILIIGALLQYFKAIRYAHTIRRTNSASSGAAETTSAVRPLLGIFSVP